MIVVRAPFRVSLFGGGTDLPAFYEKNRRGSVISLSIDKYMYIIVHPYFHEKIRIKYSKTEDVESAELLKHPIARECLSEFSIAKGVEIASIADIPSGTGLGSSSAFTVAMLKALYEFKNIKDISNESIAKHACDIEIFKLNQPMGKQDQYGSAIGGLKRIDFYADGVVDIKKFDQTIGKNLVNKLLMFYVGSPRSANDILQIQSNNMTSIEKYGFAKKLLEISDGAYEDLLSDNYSKIGDSLDQSWRLKKKMAAGISNSYIDEIYELGMDAGARGGKLLGAGGGGFILFYCDDDGSKKAVRDALPSLRELSLNMDHDGVRVLSNA